MNRVKERREELGMKQKDLLDLLRQTDPRLDIATLSRIENEIIRPESEELLEAFARHLQAPVWDLFDGITVFAVKDTKSRRIDAAHFVAQYLGYGEQNAVKRKDLPRIMGMSDREARRYFEAAKLEGLPVCSFPDGKGYYIADTEAEADRQIAQNAARIQSLQQQNWNLQNWKRGRLCGRE